jgi:ABC-2 type transport system ATP-binding protein
VVAAANRQEGIVASGLGLLTSKGWVYRDVDLAVPRGALALVTGPSGCGKTALLLAIAARMRPSAGALRLGGRDAVAQPPRRPR